MTTTIRKLGHKVSPLSAKKIQQVVHRFKGSFNLSKPKLNICGLYEVLQDMDVLEFEVVEDSLLGEMEAVSYPDKKLVKIKQSVYDKAADGDAHYRFTLAHELGHVFLHPNQQPVQYARGEIPKHKIYEDSEWQADEFASELLMDSRHVWDGMTAEEAAALFGVSLQAASYKLYKIKKRQTI